MRKPSALGVARFRCLALSCQLLSLCTETPTTFASSSCENASTVPWQNHPQELRSIIRVSCKVKCFYTDAEQSKQLEGVERGLLLVS